MHIFPDSSDPNPIISQTSAESDSGNAGSTLSDQPRSPAQAVRKAVLLKKRPVTLSLLATILYAFFFFALGAGLFIYQFSGPTEITTKLRGQFAKIVENHRLALISRCPELREEIDEHFNKIEVHRLSVLGLLVVQVASRDSCDLVDRVKTKKSEQLDTERVNSQIQKIVESLLFEPLKQVINAPSVEIRDYEKFLRSQRQKKRLCLVGKNGR